MKKKFKIMLGIFTGLILIVGLIFGVGYKNRLGEESVVIGNTQQSLIEIEDDEGNSIKIENENTLEDLQGANPRMKFWYDGQEVAYIDHLGDIYGQNITAVDTGFFTWLGSEASQITTGWITDLLSVNINTTRINSSEYCNGTDCKGMDEFFDNVDTNVSSVCGDGEVLLGEDVMACVSINSTIDDRVTGNESWNESESLSLHYQKSEVDTNFSLYYLKTVVDSNFSLYYLKTDIDTNFSLYTTTVNADTAFVNASGDKMTGNLNMTDNAITTLSSLNFSSGGYIRDNGTALIFGKN